MQKLAGPGRAVAAGELADCLGAEELLIFLRDPTNGVLLPAPGFPQTLPPGGAWRQLIETCEVEGRAKSTVPSCRTGAYRPASAHRIDDTSVLVLVGENVDDGALSQLLPLFPLATTAILNERQAAHQSYSAEAARTAASKAEALASDLYSMHRTLEKALVDAERSRMRMAFLAEAHALLGDSLDACAMLERLAQLVASKLGDLCIIEFAAQEGDPMKYAASAIQPNLPETQALLSDYVESPARVAAAREVGTTEAPVLIARVPRSGSMAFLTPTQELHLGDLRKVGGRSLIQMPLRDGTRCLGVMTMVSRNPDRPYDEDDLSLASELGLRSGLAISNAVLYVAAQAGIRVREEFLSIASHELRTPLAALHNSIQVARDLLDSGESKEKLRFGLEVAARSVDRLSRLTTNLLDVSRISSGRLELRRERLDLSRLVSEVAGVMAAEATRAQSRLELLAPRPAIGRWDRLALEQVVQNLVSNALKYGGGKPVTVSVDASDDAARLVVRDQGPGISPELLDRIFDRFERATPSVAPGFGLGLYICRQLVEAHGGSIHASSEVGKGASFEVRLPAALDHD